VKIHFGLGPIRSEFVNFRFCRETKRYEMQQKGAASRQALSCNSVVGE